jgi:hypothetical protein
VSGEDGENQKASSLSKSTAYGVAPLVLLAKHSAPVELRTRFVAAWIESGDHIRCEIGDDPVLIDGLRALLPPYVGDPVRLYRGDSAWNRRRRTYGVSWTTNIDCGTLVCRWYMAHVRRGKRSGNDHSWARPNHFGAGRTARPLRGGGISCRSASFKGQRSRTPFSETNRMASANKSKVVRRRAKRFEVVHNCAIAAACEKFLRSRGIAAGTSEKFNPMAPNRATTDELGDSVNA